MTLVLLAAIAPDSRSRLTMAVWMLLLPGERIRGGEWVSLSLRRCSRRQA